MPEHQVESASPATTVMPAAVRESDQEAWATEHVVRLPVGPIVQRECKECEEEQEEQEERETVRRKPSYAVMRKCSACEEKEEKQAVQTKLRVGPPNDRYEVEADRVADQVMRMPLPAARVSRADASVVRRQSEGAFAEEEEETLQAKPIGGSITPFVQRVLDEEDEDDTGMIVQPKGIDDSTAEVSADVQRYIEGLPSRGGPLPEPVRAQMEPRFGYSFAGVRIHTDGAAQRSAGALRARAYTVGRDVVFGAGEYNPRSSDGMQLLAHELTHVVQQGGGGPSTHVQRQGGNVAPGALAETEKDEPPVAALSIGLAGAVFTPPVDAKYRKGPKNPQLLGIVLRTLLGQEYTTEFRDQILKEWSATGRPIFNAPEGQTSFTPDEIRGPEATEGVRIGVITWAPIGFRQLLAWCGKAGKPVKLSPEQERLLEFGEAAYRAFPHVTTLPDWFTRDLFVAVMANRAAMLENLAKAIKTDAMPAGVDPASGPQAQLRIEEIEKSLANSVAVVDAIREDTDLVLHPGYQALWPPLKLRGSPMASLSRFKYSSRGIFTAPNRRRCGVLHCVSSSR